MPRFAVSLLSILALLATVAISAHAQDRLTGTVRGVRMVHVRVGPGAEHSSLRTLREGTEVEILSMQDTWARVRLSDGRVGYINSAFLETRGGTSEAERRVRSTATPPRTAPPSPSPIAPSRRTPAPTAVATATLRLPTRSPAAPTATRAVASPTPTDSPTPARAGSAPTRRALETAPPETAKPADDIRSDVRRVLRLTEEVHREMVGRHPSGAMPSAPDAPGVATTLALTGAGLVVGFLIGTVYGRRQERNRRTRVRF